MSDLEEIVEEMGREMLEENVGVVAEHLDAQYDYSLMMERGLVDHIEQVDDLIDAKAKAGERVVGAFGNDSLAPVYVSFLYHLPTDVDWIEEWREQVDELRERPREGHNG